jgi:murein DD-endopeptidase MepM/ murein hydrolase activator NlpD
MVASSFVTPELSSLPLGTEPSPAFVSAPNGPILDRRLRMQPSELAAGGATTWQGRPGLRSTPGEASAAKVTMTAAGKPPANPPPPTPDPESGKLHVVFARIGGGGTVEVLGDTEVQVNVEVLQIVARELAFPQQLRRGTPLELAYETRDNELRLTALHIGRGVGARHAFYFRSPQPGVEGFFARDGQSMEHRFLRYPLAYDRVTSPFSSGRHHPILAGVRPHHGVDFAAKSGTPVLAVGSGQIVSASWKGRYGRTIEIEHDGGYVSRYSHLQRFAIGLRAGTNVRKGEIIGYVGTSGMTTGPHLHFALTRNGVYVDPLGRNLPKRSPLDATTLGAFRGAVARVERVLAAASEQGVAAVARRNDSRFAPRG